MALTMLVARIVALLYLIAGVGVITGQINFKKIAEELHESSALRYMAGSLAHGCLRWGGYSIQQAAG